jgi:hypothetical protein
MNDKILNSRELAQIRRIAQNVDDNFQKVTKMNEKIAELTAQRDELQKDIDEMEAPVMRKTGGYKSTDIYKKVIIPQFNEDGTPKTDKNGRQLKVTKYTLRYEDTILPPSDDKQFATVMDIPDATESVQAEEQLPEGNNWAGAGMPA